MVIIQTFFCPVDIMAQNGDSHQNGNQNDDSQKQDAQSDGLESYQRKTKIPFVIFFKDLRYDLVYNLRKKKRKRSSSFELVPIFCSVS